MSETVDGRVVRGERRRAQLIEATLTVIEREGVDGVSHRSVAKIAGVSAGSVVHHFATLDDLLVAALTSANEDSVRAVEEVEGIAGLADVLIEQVVEHRTRFVALYELYLLAARRPALRPESFRWIASVEEAARRLGADEVGARSLAAALDGLGVQALLSDTVPNREQLTRVLERSLEPGSRRRRSR